MSKRTFSQPNLMILILAKYKGKEVSTSEISLETGISKRHVSYIAKIRINKRYERYYGKGPIINSTAGHYWLVTPDENGQAHEIAKKLIYKITNRQKFPTTKGRYSLKKMKEELKKIRWKVDNVMLAHMINKTVEENGLVDDSFFNKEKLDELKRNIEKKLEEKYKQQLSEREEKLQEKLLKKFVERIPKPPVQTKQIFEMAKERRERDKNIKRLLEDIEKRILEMQMMLPEMPKEFWVCNKDIKRLLEDVEKRILEMQIRTRINIKYLRDIRRFLTSIVSWARQAFYGYRLPTEFG